ncbi:DNA-binding protein (plasmid) [Halodesulfovibrio aestuarii]|uniref:Uncharacterized protein n=1 Tax=Halodesulfovibrio aestuarii TaxID=126333 RepID=A0A8G2CC57_9BACT|nr:hypothetical protein [Halodesulfovibrio aestuarii]SHJ72444.1 hypothetical protein SAMN05660830_03089 [Halodesulfovibrio aestuarii]
MTHYLQLNDFNVPGYNLTVTGDLEIRTEDLSGETSSTARVDKGVKPKKLNVSTNIKYQDAKKLRELIRVIEARGKNGEGMVYNITNRDANVAGITQVRVTDRFSWKPINGLQAWSITFTLREYLSVPEKVEKREKKTDTVAQKSEGTPVEPKTKTEDAEAPQQTASATQDPQTMLENILQTIDKALA